MRARTILAAALAAALTVALTTTAGVASAATDAHPTSPALPTSIDLPPGFQPEGIARGAGATFYVGSIRDGAIYRGSLRTGRGAVLAPGAPGRIALGLEIDRRNRLFAAGGITRRAAVFDATTGAQLSTFEFASAGLVNDVAVTDDAAYFTDSLRPVLHVVPIGRDGEFGAPRSLPLHGDLVYQDSPERARCRERPHINANGIAVAPDGRLIVVQLNTGLLFAVDPKTGTSTTIDLRGATVDCGDGLVRRGQVLHVVQNFRNQVTTVRLSPSLRSGTVVGVRTDPALDIPTTAAIFGPYLYLVNARFTTPPTPTTPYRVVRLT